MDEGCALQGMVGPFPAVMLGQATQFAVYQGEQVLQRFLVTALPSQQQLCDLLGRNFGQIRPTRGSNPHFWNRQYPCIPRKSMQFKKRPRYDPSKCASRHRLP